jgi:hypothetical protein
VVSDRRFVVDHRRLLPRPRGEGNLELIGQIVKRPTLRFAHSFLDVGEPGPVGPLELARLVDDPLLADKLEAAYERQTRVLALTILERTTILAALEDAPADLAELRGVLLLDLAWLRAEGLA